MRIRHLESPVFWPRWDLLDMLALDTQWRYMVYPSWAQSFTTRWSQLPELLSGPLPAVYVDVNDIECLRLGIVKNEYVPIEFYDGAFGNGMFRVLSTPGRSWFGFRAFRNEADCLSVPGMATARDPKSGMMWKNVAFLVLRGDIRLQRAGTGWKKPREYQCGATFEHVEAAGEAVYWLLDREPGSRPLKGIETLADAARGFGLHIKPVSQIAADIADEVRPWFTDDRRMEWFHVEGGPKEAGWQLAAMFYCLLHLKQLSGKRLHTGHLVAQIENQPHLRINWGQR